MSMFMQFSSCVMPCSFKATSAATSCILEKFFSFFYGSYHRHCKHLTSTNEFSLPVGSEVFSLFHKVMSCSTGIMQVVQR